jgi:hypothetical protein
MHRVLSSAPPACPMADLAHAYDHPGPGRLMAADLARRVAVLEETGVLRGGAPHDEQVPPPPSLPLAEPSHSLQEPSESLFRSLQIAFRGSSDSALPHVTGWCMHAEPIGRLHLAAAAVDAPEKRARAGGSGGGRQSTIAHGCGPARAPNPPNTRRSPETSRRVGAGRLLAHD